MASTISSIDASLSNLATPFQATIKAIIETESAPLKRAQALKDQLDVRRSVYTDIKTNFDALQSAVQALISTQASYGLNAVSKASVLPSTAGTTVLTGNLTSESAAVADYDISVIHLAKAESRATDPVANSEIALNKTGTFWLGGTGTAALQTETAQGVYGDFVPSSTVTAAATASVATGQHELGEGNYTLQVRDLNGARQFRLVNEDGDAVSIRSAEGISSYTTSWQNMLDGSYDTGRGQSLMLSRLGSLGSTTFHYTAKGTSIAIGASDSPRTIAAAINAASQPDGHDFRASVLSNQLVLTASHTGINHTMLYSDGAALGFSNSLQMAQNAEFKINGMTVYAAANSGLTNIVDGATFSLAGDAEGRSARLSITASTDKAANLAGALVSKFNTALTHLRDKLVSTAKTEGDKTTYTRGPLTGDMSFSSLRSELLQRMSRSYTNSGTYRRLEELGLSFDKDLKLTLDSAKFSEALKNQKTDLTRLLDVALGGINDVLARYTGSSGILSKSLTSLDDQRKTYDQRIGKYNDFLASRKQTLYSQYLQYQNQLADLGRTAQMFGINLGSNVNTSS